MEKSIEKVRAEEAAKKKLEQQNKEASSTKVAVAEMEKKLDEASHNFQAISKQLEEKNNECAALKIECNQVKVKLIKNN
jgi:Tfp pilus assembly protein PilN